MVCQQCGTEIADKALVCFRCGQATVAPTRRPAPPRPRWHGAASIVALLLLVTAALFLGRAGTVDIPPAVRWPVLAAALLLLVWRFAARRR